MTMLMTVMMMKRVSKMMMKTVRMKMLAWAGGRKFEVNFHVSLVHRIEDLPLRCLTTVNKDQQEERNKHCPRWFGFHLCWGCKCVAAVFITLTINKLRWMCDTDRKKALSRMKSSYMSHDQMNTVKFGIGHLFSGILFCSIIICAVQKPGFGQDAFS